MAQGCIVTMLLGAALVLALYARFSRPWYEYSEWTLAAGVAPKIGGRAAQVFVRTKTPTNPIDPSHGYAVQEFGWGLTPSDVVLASEVCDVVEEILWDSGVAGDDDRSQKVARGVRQYLIPYRVHLVSVDPTIVVLVPCAKSECIKPSHTEDSSSVLRLRQRFLNALEVADSIPRGEAAVWISNEDGSEPKSIDLNEAVVPLGKSGLTLENRGGLWTVVDSARLLGHGPDR